MLWLLGQIQPKTGRRFEIERGFIAHLSTDSCVAIYEGQVVLFLNIRLLYILGLDNCKAGVQNWCKHTFSKTPQGPPNAGPFATCLRWSSCSRSGSREFELWSAAWIRLGLWFSMSKGVGITLLGQVISRRTLANMTGKRYALLVAPGDHWVHWPDRRLIWIGFANVVRQMMNITKVITNQKSNLAQFVMSSLRLVWCDFRTL